ncbi:hypothetical protein [Streptomyces sp. NBC_01538]|uniref:hypothetical protein n=1 Tax=Streptomyces sp. NBC_01538 TaxID=2903897 RepID=UPI0038670286
MPTQFSTSTAISAKGSTRGSSPDSACCCSSSRAACSGDALPGEPGADGTVSPAHLGPLVGLEKAHRREHLGHQVGGLAEQFGVPVTADCYLGTITSRVDSRPWRERPNTAAD